MSEQPPEDPPVEQAGCDDSPPDHPGSAHNRPPLDPVTYETVEKGWNTGDIETH